MNKQELDLILKEGEGQFIECEDYAKLEKIGENVPENVPENRLIKISQLMKSNNKITIPEIAKELNVNEKTIKRDIDKLKDSGKIMRIGPDKGGYWEIIDKIRKSNGVEGVS